MVETLKTTTPINGTKSHVQSVAAKKVYGAVKNSAVAATASLNSSRGGNSDSGSSTKATPKKMNGNAPKVQTPALLAPKVPGASPRLTKSPKSIAGSKNKPVAAAPSGLKRPTTSMG